jgi:vacuolar protein sorting-associated protein 13A/C
MKPLKKRIGPVNWIRPIVLLQVVGEIEQVYFENTIRHTMASTIYNVHLYPSVYLKNFLPIDIVICLPGSSQEKRIEASSTVQIPTIDPEESVLVIKVCA